MIIRRLIQIITDVDILAYVHPSDIENCLEIISKKSALILFVRCFSRVSVFTRAMFVRLSETFQKTTLYSSSSNRCLGEVTELV
jgi:hypothetical protein